MFRVGDVVESKLKNTPVVHGRIESSHKVGSINHWTVRLSNGVERSFTSKGIRKRPSDGQEDSAPAAQIPRTAPSDSESLEDEDEQSDSENEDELEEPIDG